MSSRRKQAGFGIQKKSSEPGINVIGKIRRMFWRSIDIGYY